MNQLTKTVCFGSRSPEWFKAPSTRSRVKKCAVSKISEFVGTGSKFKAKIKDWKQSGGKENTCFNPSMSIWLFFLSNFSIGAHDSEQLQQKQFFLVAFSCHVGGKGQRILSPFIRNGGERSTHRTYR